MIGNPSKNGLGIIMAVLGVVLFSTKAVIVKLAYQYTIDHVTLLLFRMGFVLPFYLGIALWKKPLHPKEIKKRDFLWIICFGVMGYYMASLFDFMGLQYIKAGLERIILFVYPTLVLLMSRFFLGKQITRSQIMAILLTYIGIFVVFWDELRFEGSHVLWGGTLVLLSALTYASYIVGSGWLIPKFGVLQFTSYAMIISSISVFIHYLAVGDFKLAGYPWPVYALGCCMAVFATLIPSFLVSAAIARLGASNFSIFGSLGPVSTIVLAYFFLDETITGLQLFGMLIVILGVGLVSKGKSKYNRGKSKG